MHYRIIHTKNNEIFEVNSRWRVHLATVHRWFHSGSMSRLQWQRRVRIMTLLASPCTNYCHHQRRWRWRHHVVTSHRETRDVDRGKEAVKRDVTVDCCCCDSAGLVDSQAGVLTCCRAGSMVGRHEGHRWLASTVSSRHQSYLSFLLHDDFR